MRVDGRSLALLAAGLLLAACSAPSPPSPGVEMPARWQASEAGAGVWPERAWWSGFGSAELDRLVETATDDNHDLQAAAQRVRQSEAQAMIAGAALYPSLTASGSVIRTQNPVPRVPGPDPERAPPQTSYFLGLRTSYEIDLWGHNRAEAEAAEARVRSSRFDQETVALTLLSDVSATYFQVLALRDRLRLARETLENAQGIFELLDHQRHAGTISDLEVAQQRSALATQQAAIPSLELSERQAIDALAILLGRQPEGLEIAASTLAELRLPPIVAGLPSELLRRRPDIRRAEAELSAADADTAAAHAARFPRIGLTAQGGAQSLALASLFTPAGLLYSLGTSLTAPIFSGGELAGQEALAKARAGELSESYKQAVLSAFRDVEDSLTAVQRNGEQYEFAKVASDQANDAYHLADLRYRAGAVDFLTVLDAQRTAFQAQDALVQADVARFAAFIGLYKALGGGWSGEIGAGPSAS